MLKQLKSAAAETDEKLAGNSERVAALEHELRAMEDRATTDMQASAEQIQTLQNTIEKLEEKSAESSSHELALQELQSCRKVSLHRVAALKDARVQAIEAADAQAGGQTHKLQQLLTAASEKSSNLEERSQQVEALESELRCVCEYIFLSVKFSFVFIGLG